MKISYCLPTKNNLRYLKGSIQSIKDNSQLPYEVVVYIDADNDGKSDILVCNGIYRDVTDQDFIDFSFRDILEMDETPHQHNMF